LTRARCRPARASCSPISWRRTMPPSLRAIMPPVWSPSARRPRREWDSRRRPSRRLYGPCHNPVESRLQLGRFVRAARLPASPHASCRWPRPPMRGSIRIPASDLRVVRHEAHPRRAITAARTSAKAGAARRWAIASASACATAPRCSTRHMVLMSVILFAPAPLARFLDEVAAIPASSGSHSAVEPWNGEPVDAEVRKGTRTPPSSVSHWATASASRGPSSTWRSSATPRVS